MKKGKIFLLFSILLVFLVVGCTTGENSNTQEPNNPSDNNPVEETKKSLNIENFVSKENEVPKIIINTENKVFPTSKEEYVKGTLKIVEQPNNSNVLFEEASMGIRLRGNTTSICPKKPFRIKFDVKQSLFGLPEAKNWVLLANYYDKTQMRNYLAYLTANKLDNLGFQPASIFVEVEFNGEYLGLYLLCEQMQTGKGRIDIEQKVYDETNPSYLLELDFIDRIQTEGLIENKEYFESNGLYFVIKYPDENNITINQAQYIKSFIDRAFEKINTNHNYDRFIDVDSFIDYYLVNEIFKNLDCVQAGVFLYCQNEKLYAGPVWDFDLCLGVVGKNQNNNIYEAYQNAKMWLKDYGKFYRPLFKDDAFLQKVKARYQEVRNILYEAYDELIIAQRILREEIARDNAKWSIPGEMNLWICEQYSSEYMKLNTYQEHVNYLVDQLGIQFINLDNEFLN